MPKPANLPPAIRTDDNAFAHHTMSKRVPGIVRKVSANNPDYDDDIHEALETLAEQLERDELIPPPNLLADDYDDLAAGFAPFDGQTWLHTEWFFAEVYLYRLLIDAVRWHESGRDPFAPDKDRELANPALMRHLHEAAALVDQPRRERLHALLGMALWGNRVDLSIAAIAAQGVTASADDLICDDRDEALDHLLSEPLGHVHVVADNTGTELALDLALIDGLLDTAAAEVTLWVKHHPTFVSDAVPQDVLRTFAMIGQTPLLDVSDMGERLAFANMRGRWRMRSHRLWNSTRFLFDFPDDFLMGFEGASLVIFKGDANYRRIVGDAIWETTTPFSQATSYIPAPVLALRTLKSDPVVGLAAGLADQFDAADSQWHTNGRRGVIQFKG
jgi:uncharacterized protein with ATP-grasp and redox domains